MDGLLRFLPDGVTRFPADAYPLGRALCGEETNNVEIFVRNPNVHVTDLRRAKLELMRANQALQEARRREAELSAFIVHDLKSPLTSVLLGVQALLDRKGLARPLRNA